jgi:hypothetical protein
MLTLFANRPCKSRKVKCDEAHPSCLNCQRQGETCDYSIRLNWDGRGKKKKHEGSGQIVFSSGMIDSVLGATSGGENTDSQEDTATTVLEPRNLSSIMDAGTRPDIADSGAQPQPYPPQHNTILAQYQLQPSPFASSIDPALMDSHNQPGIYLPTPYQTYTPPDLTYAQSYERYNSRTSSPASLAQHSTAARLPIGPRRQLRQNLHFDILQHKTSLFPLPADDVTGEDEGLSPEISFMDRPSKRVRYNYPDRRDSSTIGPTDMPPPHMSSYAYGYGAYPVNQPSIPSIVPMNAPMTPAASSTHSDESYKFYPSKLSPYIAQNSPDIRRLSQDSDPRRLSVESLLSGPPGMPDEPIRKYSDPVTSDPRTPHPSSSGNGEYSEEVKIWGLDRGFRDLDIGKNDDTNAITGGSPITKREHLDFESDDVPIEFGFGVQAKDTNFEKNDYYAQ